MTETESIRLMSLDDWFVHGEALFERHHDEVGQGELQIQWPFLRRLAEAGTLEVIGLFVDEKLVGYSAMVVGTHPHENDLISTIVAHFVDKPAREGRRGVRLMQAAIEHARTQGARSVYWHARCGERLDTLLRRFMSTEHVENVYRTEV